jgi:bacterioferritin
MDVRREIVARLKKSYAMALESVENYLANSIHLEGAPAEPLKDALENALNSELKHARRLAKRIKILDGSVPGSLALPRDQNYLQPPADSHDPLTVIYGALKAIDSAIASYKAAIQITENLDYVTQDLLIELLAEEQHQRGRFNQLLTPFPMDSR